MERSRRYRFPPKRRIEATMTAATRQSNSRWHVCCSIYQNPAHDDLRREYSAGNNPTYPFGKVARTLGFGKRTPVDNGCLERRVCLPSMRPS